MDEKRLESIPLFAGLSRKERRSVAQRADEVDVEAGREIVREGEYPYEFFAIEEARRGKRGDQHLAELAPGNFRRDGADREAPRHAAWSTVPADRGVMTGSASAN